MRRKLRELRREIRATKITAEDREEPLYDPKLLASLFVAGIILIAVFAPLTIVLARHVGADPISVLLLQKTPPGLDKTFFSYRAPPWSEPAARPLVFAFAACYGAVGITAALILASRSLVKLVITSNGIFFGLLLTRYLATDIFGFMTVDPYTNRMFRFKMGYLLLIYYLSEALVDFFEGKQFSREKYEFLFNGLAALASGWILGRGFGPDAAIFAGFTYLISAFFCMFAAEKFFGAMFWCIERLIGVRFWKFFVSPPAITLGRLFRLVAREVGHPDSLFVTATLGFVAFPFLVALIYVVALERRF